MTVWETIVDPRRKKKLQNRPERRCAVSGKRQARGPLIRFVAAPDGMIVADFAERLPGRGVWVGAQEHLLRKAVSRNLFARALRREKVYIEDDFPHQVEKQLVKRLIQLLGLACRAGQVLTGFEKSRTRLQKAPVGARIEAQDGAKGGVSKLYSLQPYAPVINGLSASELGAAFGRDHVVHATLEPGRAASKILREAQRLTGLRPISDSASYRPDRTGQSCHIPEAEH